MSDKIKSSRVCDYCGTNLELTHDGSCPKCGKIGSHGSIEIELPPLNFGVEISGEGRKEYPLYKWKLVILLIAITLFPIFAGNLGELLIIIFPAIKRYIGDIGLLNIILQIIFALIASIIGYFAITRVIEIEKF